MTELRHLLGLLAPTGLHGTGPAGSPGDAALGFQGAQGVGAGADAGDVLPGTGPVGAGGVAELAGAGDAALSPQPGVAQIPALLARVCAAGLPVELSVTAPAQTRRALPPGIDLAAYRVVQEALTNVLKHAGQARTLVHIEYRPRELLITVSDDGRPADEPALDLARSQLSGSSGPGGRGLIGLRERIAVYDGELDAGPRPGGGWRLAARISLEPEDGRPGPDLRVPPEYQAASP